MRLETARLLLRDFEPSDRRALSFYHADPRYLRCYESPPKSDELLSEFLTWAKATPRINYQLAVTCIARGPVIGTVGLRQQGYPEGEAEIGFELSPEHWGLGYASEALLAMVKFGNVSLHIDRFWAFSSETNDAARRTLTRAGFVASTEAEVTQYVLDSAAAQQAVAAAKLDTEER